MSVYGVRHSLATNGLRVEAVPKKVEMMCSTYLLLKDN